jgi:hypothetical protein
MGGQEIAMPGRVVHIGCGSKLDEGVDNRAQPNAGAAFSCVVKK